MSHLLDTNICVAHFRRPAGLAHRFVQYGGGIFLPTVVWVNFTREPTMSTIRTLCAGRSPICSTMSTSCHTTRNVRNDLEGSVVV